MKLNDLFILKGLLTLSIACLCALPGTTFAQTARLSAVEAAKRIQQVYDDTQSMKAGFIQTTRTHLSGREKRGKGEVVMARPGKMRWDYLEPSKQVFVCDGKTIKMYFADENQMIITDAEQYLQSDISYSFFAGTGNILEDFSVSAPPEEDLGSAAGAYQLRLTPKEKHPQIDFVNVWADPASFVVNRIQMTDLFGSVTDIVFTDLKRNGAVDEAVFAFSPPDGTEIIEK